MNKITEFIIYNAGRAKGKEQRGSRGKGGNEASKRKQQKKTARFTPLGRTVGAYSVVSSSRMTFQRTLAAPAVAAVLPNTRHWAVVRKKDANDSFNGGPRLLCSRRRCDKYEYAVQLRDRPRPFCLFISVGNAAKRVESGLGLKPPIPGIVSHSLRLFFFSFSLLYFTGLFLSNHFFFLSSSFLLVPFRSSICRISVLPLTRLSLPTLHRIRDLSRVSRTCA